MAARKIKIDEITKIEGHANLTVEIEDGELKDVIFGVHEGSRYFEAFMRNREPRYMHELAGRICGICTVAHEIASVMAVEHALGIEIPESAKIIRKLMLISSHIQSHILHLYFLALPDYVNEESALSLAAVRPEMVKAAFEMKEATNYMTSLLGGRAVQPCTLVPGGFSEDIPEDKLKKYERKMRELYPKLKSTAELFLSLHYPEVRRDSEYLALYDGKSVPLMDGRLRTTHNEFEIEEYGEHVHEYVNPHSSAKRSLLDGRDYMVGALARLNINPHLRDEARDIARKYGYDFPSSRVAWINAAQAIENVHFAEEAFELLGECRGYRKKEIKAQSADGEGFGVIEAPRGLLIHHYRFRGGRSEYVNIITPTAMNTENIERTLKSALSPIADGDDALIKHTAEKIIRAYDPCISCSVHVLRL